MLTAKGTTETEPKKTPHWSQLSKWFYWFIWYLKKTLFLLGRDYPFMAIFAPLFSNFTSIPNTIWISGIAWENNSLAYVSDLFRPGRNPLTPSLYHGSQNFNGSEESNWATPYENHMEPRKAKTKLLIRFSEVFDSLAQKDLDWPNARRLSSSRSHHDTEDNTSIVIISFVEGPLHKGSDQLIISW